MPILDLGVQALSGRFPSPDEADPPQAPLALVKCNDAVNPAYCGLLQLQHSVSPEEMYQHEYGYQSGINQTMKDHLQDIVKYGQDMVDLQSGDVVLDIGSNDATLLKCYRVPGLHKIGIDPTGEQFREYYSSDIKLVSDYFSATHYFKEFPGKPTKLITSIAMFYDLEKPLDFVKDITKILHPEGIWILEQSYMPTMLAMNSFDTVCHEHLEYYSLKQIDWMLKRHGLRILDVELNDIYGGSFRVTACRGESSLKSNETSIDSVFAGEKKAKLDAKETYQQFKKRVFGVRDKLRKLLTAEKSKGKSIYLYGASTKGNVLLQFCDINNTMITAAAERNTEKFGHRTPATHIPIISEADARKARPDYFLVLPWHFKKEFLVREKEYLSSGGHFIFPLPEVEVI